MSELLMEIRREDGTWAPVGRVSSSSLMGSISKATEERRDILSFGWAGPLADYVTEWREGPLRPELPGIFRSLGGADVEDPRVRLLMTDGFEILCQLEVGESYELDIRTDVSARERTIRWTHRA